MPCKINLSLFLVFLCIGAVVADKTVNDDRRVQKRQATNIFSSLATLPVMVWEFIEYSVRGFFVTLFGVSPKYGGGGGGHKSRPVHQSGVKNPAGAKSGAMPASMPAKAMSMPVKPKPSKPSVVTTFGKIMVHIWNFIDNFVRQFLMVAFGAQFHN